MLQADWLFIIGAGGLFLLLGAGAIFWDWREQKAYYDAIVSRRDTREYLEHYPQRPQFGALKIGGWIALAIGFTMLIMGGVFWLWG